MWPVIRAALQRPQIVVVLALLFLVVDAALAIMSPVSAVNDPDRLRLQPAATPPISEPLCGTLREAGVP
jgi:hypothetical protein